MTKRYDLIVIGAGAAGLQAARFAATMGARTALIEKDRIGGDCTWSGCVPSKTLLKVARVAHTIRKAAPFGIQVESPKINMTQVWSHVQQVIQDIYSQETPAALAEAGIEVVSGAARFLDPFTIAAGQQTLAAKNFLLATGTYPFIPAVPGLGDSPFLSCQQIFDNDNLPEKLAVLGAGPSGVELAQAYGRLGSEVTLIDIALLPTFDPDAGEVLAKVFRREGIQFVAGLAAGVVFDGNRYHIATGNKERPEVTADMLLVAAGRKPNTAGLDLEKAGVAYDERGIKVDQYLRTSGKHIYAAGDCTGGFQSTHYAGWQGYKAVRNMLLPGTIAGVRPSIPIAVYTDPEIAHVGLSESQALELHGPSLQVTTRMLDSVDRAVIEREQDGFIKIMHNANGSILGATIVASRAGEMITEFEIALQQGLKIRDLAETMHVYPAYSMGVQRVAADIATDQFFAGVAGKVASRLGRRLAGFTPF